MLSNGNYGGADDTLELREEILILSKVNYLWKKTRNYKLFIKNYFPMKYSLCIHENENTLVWWFFDYLISYDLIILISWLFEWYLFSIKPSYRFCSVPFLAEQQ